MADIRIIQSASDYDALKPARFLGAGTSGCVLLGTWQGNTVVFKCVLNTEAYDLTQIQREMFIGMQLKKALPAAIAEMFITTTNIFISNQHALPDDWLQLMDKECKKKFAPPSATSKKKKGAPPPKPKSICILVQEYVEGVVSGHDWLADQKKAVPAECVRNVMFQLTIALCYANTIIGFQHNDLKLENIMFVPVLKQTVVEYEMTPSGDLFRMVLEPGHVQVKFIDFGGSSLRLDVPLPDFLATEVVHTNGYVPFEMSFCSADFLVEKDSPLPNRFYDADSMALFHIFMNLMCHRRAKLYPDSPKEVWVYTIVEGNGVDVFAPLNDSMLPYNSNGTNNYTHLLPLYSLFGDNSPLQGGDYLEAAAVANILCLLAMYYALGDFPPLKPDERQYIRFANASNATALKLSHMYDIIVSQPFQDAFEDLTEFVSKKSKQKPARATDMWLPIRGLIDTLFGVEEADMARSFLFLLCAPTAQQRAAFGVNEYGEYLFANALYHPFLAYKYWITSASPPQTTPNVFPETDAPFAFSDAAASGSTIQSDADAFLIAFGDALTKSAAPKPVPTPVKKPKAAKKATIAPAPPVVIADIKPTTAVRENIKKLLNCILTLYVFCENDVMLLDECPTVDDFNKTVAEPTLRFALAFEDPTENEAVTNYRDDITDMLAGYNYIKGNDLSILIPTKTQYSGEKKAINRQRICAILLDVALGCYLLYASPLDQDEATKAIVFFERAISFSTPEKVKDTGTRPQTAGWENVLGDKSVERALPEEFAIINRKFDKSGGTKSLEETWVDLKNAGKIEATISNLENIERLFEFKTEADAYDLPVIESKLYEPVRALALKDPNMERIVKHMGLDSEKLFTGAQFATMDMKNEANQTRYFHTLSVVASMVHNKDYADAERCFVEWPPKVALKPGEAYEV